MVTKPVETGNLRNQQEDAHVKRFGGMLFVTLAIALTQACGGGGGGGDEGGSTVETPPDVAGWTRLADLPAGVGRFAAVEHGGKIYVLGGYDTSAKVYIYDIAADLWSEGPNLPRGTDNNGAAVDGDKIYVFGGEAARAVQIFDTTSTSWSSGESLPTVRFASVVTQTADGVHLIGGWNYSNTTSASMASHERFDFASQTVAPGLLAPLMQARNCAAVGVIDGDIYVAGGRQPGIRDHDSAPLKSVEVYRSEADGWDVRSEMQTARACAGGAVLDGKLYVLGGELPAPKIHKTMERFDPASNSWESLPDMPYYVTGAGVVAVGTDLYVIGGYASLDGNMPRSASRYVYKYRPTPSR